MTFDAKDFVQFSDHWNFTQVAINLSSLCHCITCLDKKRELKPANNSHLKNNEGMKQKFVC